MTASPLSRTTFNGGRYGSNMGRSKSARTRSAPPAPAKNSGCAPEYDVVEDRLFLLNPKQVRKKPQRHLTETAIIFISIFNTQMQRVIKHSGSKPGGEN
ncbi:hypothetical protein [Desulfovibrio sp. Fe33]|uniref:hypothetical protein n=1 Tax=Desulfovibrio sp. Fe33 TaxID=3020842 RepID=UPI00234CF588|nr:hypothetical protein [Desulfovibrio sp. Fe33]